MNLSLFICINTENPIYTTGWVCRLNPAAQINCHGEFTFFLFSLSYSWSTQSEMIVPLPLGVRGCWREPLLSTPSPVPLSQWSSGQDVTFTGTPLHGLNPYIEGESRLVSRFHLDLCPVSADLTGQADFKAKIQGAPYPKLCFPNNIYPPFLQLEL